MSTTNEYSQNKAKKFAFILSIPLLRIAVIQSLYDELVGKLVQTLHVSLHVFQNIEKLVNWNVNSHVDSLTPHLLLNLSVPANVSFVRVCERLFVCQQTYVIHATIRIDACI